MRASKEWVTARSSGVRKPAGHVRAEYAVARFSGCPPRLTIGALIILVASVSPAVAQSSAEDENLQSMFRAGLLQSAIQYAEREQRLAVANPSLHARWTLRLMECHAQVALRAADPDTRLWQNCDATMDRFVEGSPDNPRLPWLTWQLGRCRWLRAQSLLAQYLAAPANSALREQALSLVRETLQIIENLEQDIRRRQPIAARQGLGGGPEAPANQLAQLLVDAGLMRCEALLIRGRLYPSGSPDRIAAATDVESESAQILAVTSEEWDSRAPLEIAQATALLELGRAEMALQTLIRLAGSRGSLRVSSRAAVVAIDYLARDGQISRARSLLPLLENSFGGAELELAQMQIALAELERTSDSTLRNQKLEQLLASARDIGEQYGSYWRNRADALLTGSASSTSEAGRSASIELMIAEVRQLLLANDEDGAILKLLQFRDGEAAAGHAETALQLATQAAALLQRRNEWLRAADALAPIAVQFQTEPNAATAHASSIFALSQALRGDASRTETANRYEAALKRQLETWPDAEVSSEAQIWLENWFLGKGQSAQFMDSLLSRAAACQQPDVQRAVLQSWLKTLLDNFDPEQQTELINEMREAITANRFANRDMATAVYIGALAFSQWPSSEQERQLENLLSRAQSSLSDSQDLRLLQSAQLLQHLRHEDLSAARRLSSMLDLKNLPSDLRSSLIPGFVEAIDESSRYPASTWLDALGPTAEIATDLINQSNSLKKAFGYRLQILNSPAGNDPPNVIPQLEALAAANTRDGNLQLQLAKAHSDLGRRKEKDSELQLTESGRILRRVIANSRPGSELNLSARWLLIKNQRLAGQDAQAQQAARLVLATQPLESEVWKNRFQSAAPQ